MPKEPTKKCRAAVLEAQSQGACLASTNSIEQRQLKRLSKRGELVSPITGLFASSSWWLDLNPNQRALALIRGLSKKHPTWVFCDTSAALVYGLWVPYETIKTIHVLTPRSSHANNTGIIMRHPTSDLGYVEVEGIRVTSLERTVFDCCRRYPVRKCLGIADSALRLTHRDATWLKQVFEGFSRRNEGWRQAAVIASLANPLSENGGESLARATMIMLGFATPLLQVEKNNPIDGDAYRLDFLWRLPDEREIAGELDGHDKYTNQEMTGGKDIAEILINERLRESRINALGIPVARFSIKDVRDPERFARILDAYGVPRVERKQKHETSRPLNWQTLQLDGWFIEYEVIDKRAA